MEIFTAAGLIVLGQVIMINLVLSGDNAVVIGLAAAGLPPEQRRKAILAGIIAATVFRILFAVVAVEMLKIKGLLLLGGLLLLWICWKMWQDLRVDHPTEEDHADGLVTGPQKTLRQAIWLIVVADVSMSLDNVLAIAGAAHEHLTILIIGLLMSIILMAVAANWLAKMIEKYRWIGYVGLAILIFVSLRMVYDGAHQLIGTIA